MECVLLRVHVILVTRKHLVISLYNLCIVFQFTFEYRLLNHRQFVTVRDPRLYSICKAFPARYDHRDRLFGT